MCLARDSALAIEMVRAPGTGGWLMAWASICFHDCVVGLHTAWVRWHCSSLGSLMLLYPGGGFGVLAPVVVASAMPAPLAPTASTAATAASLILVIIASRPHTHRW